jgi:hypothetical protein
VNAASVQIARSVQHGASEIGEIEILVAREAANVAKDAASVRNDPSVSVANALSDLNAEPVVTVTSVDSDVARARADNDLTIDGIAKVGSEDLATPMAPSAMGRTSDRRVAAMSGDHGLVEGVTGSTVVPRGAVTDSAGAQALSVVARATIVGGNLAIASSHLRGPT